MPSLRRARSRTSLTISRSHPVLHHIVLELVIIVSPFNMTTVPVSIVRSAVLVPLLVPLTNLDIDHRGGASTQTAHEGLDLDQTSKLFVAIGIRSHQKGSLKKPWPLFMFGQAMLSTSSL